MSRKKRVFDIAMPDEDIVPDAPAAEPPSRKGPMASAISENAEALQSRKGAAAAIRAENDALAHEYVALKEAGQVVLSLPLDDVKTSLLVRDRMPGPDEELEELVASIKSLGLSNPIRALERPDGSGYELVQGFRRLMAFKTLLAETQDDTWAHIPALVVLGEGEDVGELYRRMVDENVVRKDLSFAEMAHAARVYAADPSTSAKDLSDAVAELFSSAAYSKRSYIKLFAYLLDELGDVLKHPSDIPRALGVSLARAMKEDEGLIRRVRDSLSAAKINGADGELEILRESLGAGEADSYKPKAKRGAADPSKSKTTFHIATNAGRAKCTAGQGRLEIRIDRDFSAIDRERLERAIATLVEGIG